MDKQVSESTLLRKSIIGIRAIPFTTNPVFKINNWNVFYLGDVNLLPPEQRKLNLNYQIERNDNEKILVRIYLNTNKSQIIKTNTYNLNKMDSESVLYLAWALIQRIGIPISQDHKLTRIEF